MGPSSAVLHVAQTIWQRDATAIGVFTGAIETTITPDPPISGQTFEGRRPDIGQLPSLLDPDYPYLVIEAYPGDAAVAWRRLRRPGTTRIREGHAACCCAAETVPG